MFRKIAVVAVCSVAFVSESGITQAQFGGIQLQVGDYGPGLSIGNSGFSNGYYDGYYGGYRNGYGSPYYGNSYSRNYSGYNTYGNGRYYGNSMSYSSYPIVNYGYRNSRAYVAPLRGIAVRRFRYR